MILKTRLIAASAALLCTASLGAYCARAAELVVGNATEFTGANAAVGTGVGKGVVVATEEINRTHALGANTIKLLQDDDGTDRTQAQALINRYGIAEKALAIIGPVNTSVAMASAPLANDLKIPMITGAYASGVLKAGPYIFKITETSENNMATMAKYTVDVLKPKRCYLAFIRDNEGYVALKVTFGTYAKAHGVEIAGEGSALSNDSDFSTLATSIVGSKADCLQVDMLTEVGANMIVQARTAGLPKDTIIVAGSAQVSPQFTKVGGAAVEGVYVFADYTPGGINEEGKMFEQEFKQKYGAAPDNWGAVGYAAMKELAWAIREAGPNPTRDGVRDALAKTHDVPTILGHGKVTFDADKVPHYGASILVVKNGAFVPPPN
jgi:branched-chain amino acid transport system substrate-binding protein